MVKIQDGLQSMPWFSAGPLRDGWRLDIAPIPPRDKFKYTYDLWSNGLAFEAFSIGRTHKVAVRAPDCGDGIWLLNFDTRGRLVNSSYTGTRWREITLSPPVFEPGFRLVPYPSYRPEMHRLVGGTWLRAKWTDTFDHTNLLYRAEIVEDDDPFYRATMDALDSLVAILSELDPLAVPEETAVEVDVLRRLPVKSHAELLDQSDLFHAILGPGAHGYIPVEPPELAFDHYHAIPVRVQDGCGGPCTFCTLYERKIDVVARDEVFRQIDNMAAYLGEEADHFRKVVLLHGDALTVPAQQLGAELAYAAQQFALPGDGPFAHAFAKAKTIVKMAPKELDALRDRGLANVNMGLESGSQELLDKVKPGQKLTDFHEAVVRLTEAGIGVSINIIAGLGGPRFAEAHVQGSVDFIGRLPAGTTVFYSPFIVSPESRYAIRQEAAFGRLETPDIERQSRIFEQQLGAYEYLFVPI
ncbi:MAG: radical SAM protein [Solirubrobacteraceae bacterium]